MGFDRFRVIQITFLSLLLSFTMAGQSWNFIKEKDGVKLYTRKDVGKSQKSYRGVTDIHAPAEKVFAFIEDVNNTDWWDKNISKIKVLLYEKNKRAQFYLIYDLPWPLTDRDLCVDVEVSLDPVTDVGKIMSVAVPGIVPESPDMIRIKEYNQLWTITPAGKTACHVELEGNADPAGNIPDWLTNMIIVDSPLQVIEGVRERTERK